jgi:ribonuclease R
MDKFEQKILDFLSRPDYVPVKAERLATKLKLSKKLTTEYETALDRLMASGKVRANKKGKLRLISAVGTAVGIMRRTTHGSGYVVLNEPVPGLPEGDVYVSSSDVRDAHSGDEVLIRILNRRRSGGQRCGRVEEVLIRASTTFVGTYFEQADQGYVRVDGRTFLEPVHVGDPGAKGSQDDDKVLIEMLRFPTHYRAGEAVLTKVLGPRGALGVDTESIIHEFALPDEFPKGVLQEARAEADRFDESDIAGRNDLTKDVVITIDPGEARDFDDAISLDRSEDGHWHLGVHIADVSHFVRPGGALDTEARKRGTSVYLPRRVLPMLPEVISNGLASLQQGQVRYVKSAFIEFTADGIPVHTSFANAAVKVTRRFAYEEVMPIINQPEQFRGRVSAKVRQLLSRMYELAMILRRRRFEAGSLGMDIPEVKIDFDKQGRVTGAHETEHDESHQIIEEFMLAANVAVATELADRTLPYLRRVHGSPDPVKLARFGEFVAALGYPMGSPQGRTDIQAVIDRVRDEPEQRAVNYALLRSMKPAEYSAAEVGHYALAFDNYCHFTSPIRRYPDLTIHRLIGRILRAKGKPKHADPVELIKLGKHCSTTERRAAAAERELVKIKLLTYMSERVGDELDAFITGVERFGIFCQGMEIPVEGLVHISAVDPNDHFDYDSASHSITGRRTGRTYRLGDPLRVVVAHVDVDRRELDFRILPAPGKGRRKPTKSNGSKVRAKTSRKSSSRGAKKTPTTKSATKKRSARAKPKRPKKTKRRKGR